MHRFIGFGYHPTVGYYPVYGASPPKPAMPKQPPLPSGFIRWPGNRRVTKIARGAAVTYLTKLPIGGFQSMTDEDGTTIAAFQEWHFDNHPKGGGDPFWHPGISMLVKSGPTAVAAKAKPVAKKIVKQTYADIPFVPMSRYGGCAPGWG